MNHKAMLTTKQSILYHWRRDPTKSQMDYSLGGLLEGHKGFKWRQSDEQDGID